MADWIVRYWLGTSNSLAEEVLQKAKRTEITKIFAVGFILHLLRIMAERATYLFN